MLKRVELALHGLDDGVAAVSPDITPHARRSVKISRLVLVDKVKALTSGDCRVSVRSNPIPHLSVWVPDEFLVHLSQVQLS